MSSRFQRSPLAGSDMLRRGDNLNHITTRQLRIQSNDGSFSPINSIPHVSDSDGTIGISAATITANGSAYLPGTLAVDEGTLIKGTLDVLGATNITGSVDIGGKLTCTGMTTTGVAIFNTNVVIKGDTQISGPTQISGNSTLQNLIINNEFITNGPTIINNEFTSNGPTIINNEFTSNGPSIFNQTTTFNETTIFNKTTTFTENALIEGGASMEYLILNPQPAPILPEKDASMNPVDEILFPKADYSAMWMDANKNVWVGDNKVQMQHEIQKDSWFDKYLLAQPAAPTEPSDNKTSAEVLIWWKNNPPQIDASFLLQKLPRIAKLRGDFIGSGNFILSVTNTDQLPGTVADAVRGIALVKGNGTSGVGIRIVNGTRVPVYVHYLAGIPPPAASFDAKIWFEGYGDTSRIEVLEVTGLSFAVSSGPSVVRNMTASSITYNGVTIGYHIPQYSDAVAQLVPRDSTNPANPAIVTYYTTITPTASRRYGRAYNNIALVANTSALSLSFNSLFPDTTYSFSTYATNSTGNDGVAGSGTFLTSLQPNLNPDKFINNLTLSTFFPTTPYTTPIYSNGTELTSPVLYSSNGKITTSSIGPLSIHVEGTRGSSANDIMILSSSTTALSTGGFGIAPTSINDTTTGIKISEDVNSRIDPGINETTGFYQTTKYIVELTLSPGLSKTLTLTQSFSGNDPTSKTNSFTFYTDDLDPTANPAVSSVSATRTSGTTMVVGIPISNSDWNLGSIGFSATNMGKYFHTGNPITYSFANTSTTTLVSSLPTSRTTSTYTSSGLSISGTATTYAYQPLLTITAKNTCGLSHSGTVTLSNMLLDPESIKLSNNVTRIRSPRSITDMDTPAFDNTITVTTRECILANGTFVGLGSGYFKDYSPIGGSDISNQASSGGIASGYRYVTLSFNGPGDTGNSNATITVAGITSYTMYYRAVDGVKPTKWINGRNNDNINDINDPTFYGINSTTPLGGLQGKCLFPTPFTSNTVYVCVGIPDSETAGISGISISYS